jgi:hypothetical protein
MDVYLATEDALGQAVGERLVAEAGDHMNVAVRIGGKGNTFLRQKLPELMKVARSIPVVLFTDLDHVECPPTLIRSWTGTKKLADSLLFRVVVREVESWLLADREAFADFTGIALNKLPSHPESLDDPKQSLLNLVRRHARSEIKRELLPATGIIAVRGLGYNPVLRQFVRDHWSPERAAATAESLARARQRLQELGAAVDWR